MADLDARTILATGAFLVALGIGLGAFGAHALRAIVEPQRLEWWQTATQYLLWNAIGLVALSANGSGRSRLAVLAIAAGAGVFAGSLYLMALTGDRWLGMITPIGGVAMIAGWLIVGWRAVRSG